MMYNISAHGLPYSTIVGIDSKTKGNLASFHSRNMIPIDVSREQLVPFLTQSPMVWSPFQYKDNWRKQSNSNCSVGMLVFDADDGASSDMITKQFGSIFEHYIIIPSTGWTPEYEKFRIIIPLSQMVKFVNNSQYKRVMKYFTKKLGLELDMKTMEVSRFFFTDNHPLKKSFDTMGVNDASIITKAVVDSFADEVDIRAEERKVAAKAVRISEKYSNSSRIPHEYLILQPKYLEHISNMYPGNYNDTETKMIGYLKMNGRDKSEIDIMMRDIRATTGGQADEAQHNNRMSLI